MKLFIKYNNIKNGKKEKINKNKTCRDYQKCFLRPA